MSRFRLVVCAVVLGLLLPLAAVTPAQASKGQVRPQWCMITGPSWAPRWLTGTHYGSGYRSTARRQCHTYGLVHELNRHYCRCFREVAWGWQW